MASTNPFLHDSPDPSPDTPGLRRRRGAGAQLPRARQASRRTQRLQKNAEKRGAHASGWPAFEGLKPVLMFLAVPAFVVLAITVTGGGWPKPILYTIALGLGLTLALSALKGVELVLACLLIYLPFSKVFVVPLAPGVNGTNMLILLGLGAAILQVKASRQRLVDLPAGSMMVFVFGAFTAFSAVTVSFLPGGRLMLFYSEMLSYKAWVDQFIFYFILLVCIRDAETAKRCVIYAMIGTVLVILFAIPEMLQKAGRSTIDKSRIGGPHLQSNNFGGFVAYTVLPLIAMFVVFMKDLRAWLLVPYFLLTAKVLITTFSRGAYVAIVIGGVVLAWYRGKGFLAFWSALLLCALLIFPSLIPDAITDRMGALMSNEESSAAPVEEKVDKSTNTRLILWKAAIRMIEEDPFLGKGFKAFPMLKEEYTEVEVEESDPHSMYLYLASQKGLPSMFLFIAILGYCIWLGRYHSKNKDDAFIRAVGIGGAAMTVCLAVVCVFGSRAVSLNFTVYFWTMMVVMQVLRHVQLQKEEAQASENKAQQRGSGRKRPNKRPDADSRFSRRETALDRMQAAQHSVREDAEEPGVPSPVSDTDAKGPDLKDSRHLAAARLAAKRARRSPRRGAAAWQNGESQATTNTSPPPSADTRVKGSLPTGRKSRRRR